MTVGDALPVNDSSFDISRPMATKGRSTSAVINPCLATSGSYFSMYMRTVAPTEPVLRGISQNRKGAQGRRGGGGSKWSAKRSHRDAETDIDIWTRTEDRYRHSHRHRQRNIGTHKHTEIRTRHVITHIEHAGTMTDTVTGTQNITDTHWWWWRWWWCDRPKTSLHGVKTPAVCPRVHVVNARRRG